MFITFEGIDGCGKTTQVKLLYQYLKNKGFKVILTKEPGGTKIGKKIRKILLTPNNNIFPITELLLYLSSRVQLIDEIIIPKLAKNIIICDRFYDATFAYQGYGRNLNLKLISKLNNVVIRKIKPDLTFLLDIKPEISLKRCLTFDRIEQENIKFHLKVQQGYLKIAKKEPNRIKIIDGTKTKEEIFKTIQKEIKKIFQKIQNIRNNPYLIQKTIYGFKQ